MVSKNCPKCNENIPVACKMCMCGHTFQKASNPGQPIKDSKVSSLAVPSRPDRPRRSRSTSTFYYDQLTMTMLRQKSTLSQTKTSFSAGSPSGEKKKRGRPKGSGTKNTMGAGGLRLKIKSKTGSSGTRPGLSDSKSKERFSVGKDGNGTLGAMSQLRSHRSGLQPTLRPSSGSGYRRGDAAPIPPPLTEKEKAVEKWVFADLNKKLWNVMPLHRKLELKEKAALVSREIASVKEEVKEDTGTTNLVIVEDKPADNEGLNRCLPKEESGLPVLTEPQSAEMLIDFGTS